MYTVHQFAMTKKMYKLGNATRLAVTIIDNQKVLQVPHPVHKLELTRILCILKMNFTSCADATPIIELLFITTIENQCTPQPTTLSYKVSLP